MRNDGGECMPKRGRCSCISNIYIANVQVVAPKVTMDSPVGEEKINIQVV